MNKTNKYANEKSFDNIIKEKLKDYILSPDEISWDTIEKCLNKKSKKIVWQWYWMSSVAVAVAVLIGLIFPFHHKIVLYEMPKQVPGYEEKITKDVSEEANMFAVLSPTVAHKRTIRSAEKQEPISEESVFIPDTEIIESTVDEFSSQESVELKKNVPDVFPFVFPEETIYFAAVSKHSNSLAFHIGSGNNWPNINEKTPMYGNSYDNFFKEKITENAPFHLSENMLTANDFSHITHQAPLSFGLTFKKELNTTFALETGLVYTFLASKFKNEYPKRDAILHLHYLGIPLNLHTKLYATPHSRWNVYLSTGFMIEKGLLSHYVQNKYLANAYSNKRIDGLQISLNIALGIEYKLFKNYGIYFEPKINYYIENNQPMSVRTENPLIIGLNAGIRWHW